LKLLFAFEQFIMNTEEGEEPSEILPEEELDQTQNPN